TPVTVKHTVTVQPVPNLVYEDHAIDDDDMGSSDGNGDGVVNPGETIECKVQIRNIGTRTAPNVVGIISTDSQYVTLNDDTETYGNIAAGQTAWTLGDYDFEVSSSAPVGENITFDLTLTDSLGHEWNDTFNIQVGGTEHDIAVTDIDLPPRAEVGDTVTVTGTVENMGLDDEQDVEIRMVVNGSVEDTAYIDLASGASADVALEWSPDEAGTYEIWVNATPVPGEDAVNNNGLNASITVYADRGKVFVDDVHGDVSGYDDLLDALSDEGYDPVNASDAGTELTAMLRARWVLLPAPNTLPEDAMEVLRDYVRLGGGLLMLADADPDGYSRMTGPMGINWSFSPGKYDDTTSDIGDHAVTDDVDTVYLRSPAASLDLDGGTALVTSSNGAIVAAAVEYGEGRAVLISDDDLLGDDSLSREDNLRLGMNAASWLEWSVVEDDVGIALLDAPEIAPPNTTIDVELAVINLGTANATDIEVRLTHGDDVTTRSVASLSPGEWANLTIGIEFDSFGRYRLATSTGATDDAPSNERTWKAIDIFEGNGTIGIYTWEGNRSDHGRFFSTLIHLGFSTEEIDTEIRYEDIAGLDSVYLIDPGNLEDEEIAAIQDFVRSGKGLLLVSDDPDAANLIADALGITWASWPGREGATDRIARYHFTEHVGSLYLSRPYAHVSGPFLFADYANDTLQGSNITFGEGRAIGTSDIGLFANDTLDREDNARFARQLARYLHRAPADVDGAIVNLSFRPFVERDETSEVTATVHNLGSDTGEFDVVLEFDGDEVNRTTVELDASEHVPVTLGFVPDLNGTFNLSMYVEPPSGDMRTANDRLNGTISVLRVMLDDPCEEDTGWEEESLWHISGRRYRSGHRSWWYGNESTGDYSGGSGDASLRRSFTLVSVRDAVLTFRYYVDLDDGDRAEVNLSSDGGSNWTTLMTLTGLAGRWDSATIDLGDHEGEDVIIAFHVTHNGSGSGEGVFLEDIRVAGFANLSQVLEILSPVGDDYVAGQWGVRAHARDTDGIENVSWSLDNGSWEEMTLQEGSEGDGVWDAIFNSTTVADGDHRITVRSTNSTGYIREAVVDFVVDNTPPLVDITSPDEGTIGGEVWINATADDATSGIEGLDLRIDDGNWTGTDGSTLWNSTGVSDGDHVIEVRARDRAGNRATDTVNVTVDNTPPDISVSSPSEGEEVKGRVNITVRITDATGVDRVEYRIDDGTWYGLNLTSGDDRDGVWKTSWNSTEVAEGDHDITVRAIDDLGNRGNELVSVYVNNLDDPPTIEIVEPEDGSLVRQVVSLTVTATDDESVEAVRYRVDDGDWIDLTRNDEYWTGQWDCRGVADGDHTLHFIAIDASDQNATTEVNLTVDNTAPEIEPLGPTGYVKEVIKIRVRVRDEHLRDVVYRVDDDEWLYMQYRDDVHFGYVNTSAYPDGNHTLEVRADDEVDNVNSTSWEITFDNTWPTVNITGPSDDEVVRGTVNITGFFEEDHPVSVEYRVGDKAWKEITIDGSTFNVTWDSTTMGDGEASIYVRCTDRAGNIGYDSVDVT
ncbi:MAG TPA: hypothetical protein EYP43_03090, partial [Thermoplasmata archaeon]|nr:hypothetical protein [Thermoplasmata archaeon]